MVATERAKPRVERLRRLWVKYRQPKMALSPERLVFIDETSVKTNLTRLRGRSLKGTRVQGTAPFGGWNTQTFIAGLSSNGLVAPWLISGAMVLTGRIAAIRRFSANLCFSFQVLSWYFECSARNRGIDSRGAADVDNYGIRNRGRASD